MCLRSSIQVEYGLTSLIQFGLDYFASVGYAHLIQQKGFSWSNIAQPNTCLACIAPHWALIQAHGLTCGEGAFIIYNNFSLRAFQAFTKSKGIFPLKSSGNKRQNFLRLWIDVDIKKNWTTIYLELFVYTTLRFIEFVNRPPRFQYL